LRIGRAPLYPESGTVGKTGGFCFLSPITDAERFSERSYPKRMIKDSPGCRQNYRSNGGYSYRPFEPNYILRGHKPCMLENGDGFGHKASSICSPSGGVGGSAPASDLKQTAYPPSAPPALPNLVGEFFLFSDTIEPEFSKGSGLEGSNSKSEV
jgi:hypothetical protein